MTTVFEQAGVHGRLHARCLGTGAEIDWGADDPVVLASVVKVPLVLEFGRQAAAGQLDPAERVRAVAAARLGGTGLAGCADDVELSLRDAAYLALSVSDNTAADLLFDRVGLDNVRSLVRELGLARTRIVGAPRDIVRSMVEDLGVGGAGAPGAVVDSGAGSEDSRATAESSRAGGAVAPGVIDAGEFARRFSALGVDEVFGLRALDPLRTNASTPREMTRMLAAIARDEAAPPEVCRWLRGLMGLQVNWYRLAAAFPPEVAVWGKTGTLPGLRHEIGVVEYPDGGRYAVAVFTRARTLEQRLPHVDRAIGAAAHEAVERLRRRAV
ncbi:serine hydrolase [Nocardia sp. alder85J]|uniref:serine hydrolase n=1 Tax=Nocardia sp. alder85J TaxID=2862949 RepID=UPI001CD1F13F|nr:serine hydrolase [Nocardia sp. alder85J]MCX4097563.1 class A beta-lactamase-related serine hydrolase [Nocardia sp. alder85J]